MPTGLSTVWFFREEEHGEDAGTLLMNWGGCVVRVVLPSDISQHFARVIMNDPAACGSSAYGVTFIPKQHVDMPLLNLATFGHPLGSAKEREAQERLLAPFNVEGARKSPPNPLTSTPEAPPVDLMGLFGKGDE
jgi:hypothetical protein